MLTLGIRYLTRSVAASDVADRRRVEWPPHPGRVFMALAAAHFETGADAAEREALEWLEAQPAPQIHAPAHAERPVVTHYVPVNDKAGPSKAALQSAAGLTRTRQPRTFARAWLEDDSAYLVWPEAQPGSRFGVLENLCGKVTRIGHSTSLVQVWASQAAPERPVNWLPDEAHGLERFRVAGPGSLLYLERQFNQYEIDEFFGLDAVASDASDKKRQKAAKIALREKFQNQPPVRLRPEMSLSCGYAQPRDEAEPSAPGTVFDPRMLVYALCREDGPYRHLDLAATLQLTSRFREALLQHLGPEPPEVLSGHHGGAPSELPHMALLPLPFVGREHAHGGILGVAVALPRDIDPADRQRLLRALGKLRHEGLKLGALGRWRLGVPETGASPLTLREHVWTGAPLGARQWATVTPYVCDRHAKAKDKAAYQRELEDAIRESWRRVRQSSEVSVEVVVTPVSAHLGAPASHEFPRLARKDGSQCRHTHAILIFDRPIAGPLLLGAGRYRGYGLCRPLGEDR
jgi:CRISPR-associated protein Csb2